MHVKLGCEFGRELREEGIHLRNAVDLTSSEQLAASGAKYLILRSTQRRSKDIRRFLERRYGPPLCADDTLRLFDLRSRHGTQGPPTDRVFNG
jgi:hypothetical protein